MNEPTKIATGTPPSADANSSATPSAAAPPDLGALSAQIRELRQENTAWREKFEAKVGDLGRGLGKVRSRVRDGRGDEDDAGEPRSASSNAVTHEDLISALRLGEVSAKLPEPARARLKKMRESGTPIAMIAEFAEALAESIPHEDKAPVTGAGTAGDPPVPTGAAATSAPRTSPSRPRSLSEFASLRHSNPELFKQLMADPTFHPEDLPSVVTR